jgi:hypothetical protein
MSVQLVTEEASFSDTSESIYQISTKLHGIIFHKTVVFVITVMLTSNHTFTVARVQVVIKDIFVNIWKNMIK